MATTGAHDPCLDWLFSSPVAMYISGMDLAPDSTMPHSKDQMSKETISRSTQLPWVSERHQHQHQRRPSNSSDSSAPGMVVDVGAPSPASSCEGDDYHASGDVIWDSWLEDTSFSDSQFHMVERGRLPLRNRRSNLTLSKASVGTSNLSKMRSVGDFRGLRSITHENRCTTCVLPPKSHLHTSTNDLDTRPRHDDKTWNGPRYTAFPPQSIPRTPSCLRNGTLLEPRPQAIIPSINTSLYTVPPPAEWLSQNAHAAPPPSVGEKSVFEDWDEPKLTFWRRNCKRKRRSTSESRSDGDGNNKSPRKKGGKLWNLNLLASMPGML
jgi:hypothetical protein